MISTITLSTTAGTFYAHKFHVNSKNLIVFLPGLMEPKAGLFYIWNDMARHFQKQGHSCLLFDLAGQGDSLLPFSFDLWLEQRNAIQNTFQNYNLVYIARGISSILVPLDQKNVVIYPSMFNPVADQLRYIRWQASPINTKYLTLTEPQSLSKTEKDCFYRLGAEVECIGGIQLPITFVDDLIHRLPRKLTDKIFCYEAKEGHLLFDKKSQREELFMAIATDLNMWL
jgi:hypothetical protein